MRAIKIMFKKRLYRIILVLFMFAVLMPLIVSETFAQWSIEAVDSPKYFDFLTSRAIVTDSAGNPHIAYGGDNLYYANHDGTSWNYETVDNSSDVGKNASIAIDSQGYLHISYSVSYGSYLKYATNTSGSWVTMTVDDNGGRYSSIATDSSDTVHISHLGMGGLKYTTNTSGSWVTEIVGGSTNYISIAVDSLNKKAHISYINSANGDLEYATNASGSWVIDTIEACGWYSTSIALDSSGRPHITYAGINGDLKYATNPLGPWITESIDDDGRFSSIAIDPSSDTAHISFVYYAVGYNGTVKYASGTSGSWTIETVDAGTSHTETSIALDSSNNVHIDYYNQDSGDLNYVSNSSGGWTTETVDNGRLAGMYTSIAADSSNKVHMSYYSGADMNFGERLMYVTNASGSWVTETLDAGDVGYHTSIALDSSDHVHISYNKSSDPDLKYATNASGSWETEIIDEVGNVGANTSIALDSYDGIHISYTGWDPGGNYFLKYAKKVGGLWAIETIDDTGNGASITSIAIDSSDNVHISYYDRTLGALRYATNSSGTWSVQTVDDDGDAGRYSSIAVDSANYIHISYIERTNSELRYTNNLSGTWVTEVVDNDAKLADTTSIALDSLDNVHISYPGSLKYATNASGAWVTETVDDIRRYNTYNSIAIDSLNGVHISYWDYSNKDLKYATKAGMSNNSDLTVSMTDNPDPVQVNQQLIYSTTIINNGPDAATGVTLADTLPSGVIFVSATSDQGTCSEVGGVVTCVIGNIANGTPETVTIIVTAPDTVGTITNTATVDCTSNDPVMSNNTAAVDTTVQSLEPSIEETIGFFDQAVEGGTITGSAGWIWGQIQLNRMRQLLTRARFSIERGYIGAACWQLRRAYLGCDGEGYDWVVGEDAGELAQMIYDLAVSLDCWWTRN